MNYFETNRPLLAAAYDAWLALAPFRRNRERSMRFTFGSQWDDIVPTPEGPMSAEQFAVRSGRRPITNNLLRRLVKSVIGRYRYNRADASTLPADKRQTYTENNLDELDCRSLEEFLISGCAVQRVASGRTLRGSGRWVDAVAPDRFFASPISDPRGWDAEIVGMIHDWSLAEAVIRLAGDDMRLAADIRSHYAALRRSGTDAIPTSLSADSSFFHPADTRRCRVIEVWSLEASEILECRDPLSASVYTVPVSGLRRIEATNRKRLAEHKKPIRYRWVPRTEWLCRWLAPDGAVLLTQRPDETATHPFHFRFYPLLDGRVHSLVDDVIGQQIYINELISLIDHVVSCSAKGVLIFPTERKLPDMSWQEVASAWSSPGGIIPVKGPSSDQPEQIHSSATFAGATELLSTQLKMFEDVSGVSNALMGRSSSGNIGAEHYEGEVKNAIIAIADLLDTFSNFISTRNAAL
ncbi:MAG: hypothetical protein K2I64_04305 [Muribaculaceae bacterium]|nr:hypothetical protein [Muribaculaceae bacterium]